MLSFSSRNMLHNTAGFFSLSTRNAISLKDSTQLALYLFLCSRSTFSSNLYFPLSILPSFRIFHLIINLDWTFPHWIYSVWHFSCLLITTVHTFALRLYTIYFSPLVLHIHCTLTVGTFHPVGLMMNLTPDFSLFLLDSIQHFSS